MRKSVISIVAALSLLFCGSALADELCVAPVDTTEGPVTGRADE